MQAVWVVSMALILQPSGRLNFRVTVEGRKSDRVDKLAALREKGDLTEGEFQEQKRSSSGIRHTRDENHTDFLNGPGRNFSHAVPQAWSNSRSFSPMIDCVTGDSVI